jgi:HTH-type transcriptional regulator, transcriptional repressor of NAD biosynthesis genes
LKRETGLVIGKFMPPHAGHLHLLDVAQRQVDEVTVILFSKPREPIPGALRLAWLRELLPGAPVFHVDRDFKVDFDDPNAWNFWVSAIRDVLPSDPTLVFSSEAYGDELARRLGARHVLVDPARCHVPVSATQIRQRPLAHWDHIPPPVRPYFVRRVAILGAESTGKTTLARALADHFQTLWVPEYAREYLSASAQPCTRDDMLRIAHGHAALEDRLARQANRLLFSDTDLLTTQIWHEHYFGDSPSDLRRLASERRADLYLLCSPDMSWIADGLRDSPNHRQWFHERFQRQLEARGDRTVILSGPHERRLAVAIGAVEGLLAEQ